MAPTTTEILAALVGFDTTSRNLNPSLPGQVRACPAVPGPALCDGRRPAARPAA